MDKKAVKALRGSIKKWERIVLGVGEDRGRKNCPLCEEYWSLADRNRSDCDGCPVAKDTGNSHCRRSPYEVWQSAFEEELEELAGALLGRETDKCLPIGPRSLAAAIAEYEYLCGLLDKELAKK